MKYQKFSFALALIVAFFALPAFAQESGGVRGKIRTAKGDGIGGAVVSARQNGADVKSVKADADGKFVLGGLAPGVYNIVFDRSGYATGVKYNVEVESNKIRDLGARLVLTVDQGTQVIIKGAVFDEAGKSVAGVKVEIEKVSSNGSTKKLGSGYTSSGNDPGIRGGDGNARGEFTFRFSEGAAKYRVTAQAKDAKASKEIDVDSAGIYRLALSLEVKNEDN